MTALDGTKWMLEGGRDRPMVYPFDSREAAEEWADDHGLIGYRPEPLADRDEHEQICGRCRVPWPCEHVKLDHEAQNILYRAKHTCTRCGKHASGTIVVPGGGDLGQDAIYHAKQGACRKLARRELERLGHIDACRKLDSEDRRLARQRVFRRERKAGADRTLAYRRALQEVPVPDDAPAWEARYVV